MTALTSEDWLALLGSLEMGAVSAALSPHKEIDMTQDKPPDDLVPLQPAIPPLPVEEVMWQATDRLALAAGPEYATDANILRDGVARLGEVARGLTAEMNDGGLTAKQAKMVFETIGGKDDSLRKFAARFERAFDTFEMATLAKEFVAWTRENCRMPSPQQQHQQPPHTRGRR